jgi:hypothetical protein
LRDKQDLSRFPLARLPAGFADRVLISHRGVGAFAPASLSDAVYRFEAIEVSSGVIRLFYFFYKSLKCMSLISYFAQLEDRSSRDRHQIFKKLLLHLHMGNVKPHCLRSKAPLSTDKSAAIPRLWLTPP